MNKSSTRGACMDNNFANLYRNIRNILDNARISSYRAVNFAMVSAYWNYNGQAFLDRKILSHFLKKSV